MVATGGAVAVGAASRGIQADGVLREGRVEHAKLLAAGIVHDDVSVGQFAEAENCAE